MFVWSMVATSFLMVLAAPVLIAGMYMIITDRTVQTAFFEDSLGGSSYLYQNLFWFFGHPEVYILALPGFGIVSEILPVFCRKPLFGYKTAAAGMIGVTLLSFFVWQHHLFDSGINPDMRPLFMLTTELISIPTGFIYLVAMGTLWKAKIRFSVPMLFTLGMYFNFLIGGISGVFLSDVPADTTEHGSFFVMAHFHYTIMGGLIFALMAGIYYWLPKMTGLSLNEGLGKAQFWLMFISFNATFLPLFAVGMAGQPRRVFEYARNLQTLNDWVSISSFFLGASILLFVINFVWSTGFARVRAADNPWRSRGLEWQVPSPPPPGNFARVPVVLSGPYEYGIAGRAASRRPQPAGRRAQRGHRRGVPDPSGGLAMTDTTTPPPDLDPDAEEAVFYHEAALNASWTGIRLALGALSLGFGSFIFAFFYLKSLNSHGLWYPAGLRRAAAVGGRAGHWASSWSARPCRRRCCSGSRAATRRPGSAGRSWRWSSAWWPSAWRSGSC